MSEIEKMYENANIKAKEYCDRDSDACMTCCPEWKNRQNCWKYKSAIPPFTAEKQIELIKWLSEKNYTISIDFHENEWGITTEDYSGYFQDNLSDALASITNNIWQDLTPEEQQQVKGILE